MAGLNSRFSAVKRKARLQLTVENITPCSNSPLGNPPYLATNLLKAAGNHMGSSFRKILSDIYK